MTEFDTLWPAILDVGRNAGSGGYRRYAWSDADLTLREWFTGCAAERGMDVEEDRNGNLWAWWLPPGWDGDPSDAFVTGSHLDSVPDGGAFDGPLGVVSAFAESEILPDRVTLVAIYAEPALRGLGLGSALLDAIMEAHPGLPVAADVLAGNAAGETFSRARGFVPGEDVDEELGGEHVRERRWWLRPVG